MFVRPSRGRGRCKVSSLLSRRADMQPTDMHSPLLQPQPRLLQPLLPLTATGTYERQRAPRRPLVSPPPPSPPPEQHRGLRLPAHLGFRRPPPSGLACAWHVALAPLPTLPCSRLLALTPVSLFVTSNSLLSRLRAVLQNLSEHCV